jgi:uncharacterized protein YpmB
MNKKTIIILIIASIMTMIIVGIEVYFWKKSTNLQFISKQEGIDFCNNQIPLDQKEDCIFGVESIFK